MTAVTIGPVPLIGRPLSDGERAEALEWLARSATGMPPLDLAALLAQWAHPSLTARKRLAAFALYAEARAQADDLFDGILSWQDFEPELTCIDRQERAAELAANRAAEWLYELVHGTGEK